jgi:hypothetical protein
MRRRSIASFAKTKHRHQHAAFIPVRILRSNEENIKKIGVIHRVNV